MKKVCRKCGIEKSFEAFYFANGQPRHQCKECAENQRRARLASNSASRLRQQNYMHQYYENHRDKLLSRRKATRKIYTPDPVKRAAREELRLAVLRGDVIKPSSCEVCNARCHPHGHHANYARPLEVQWLCKRCHTDVHKWKPEAQYAVS